MKPLLYFQQARFELCLLDRLIPQMQTVVSEFSTGGAYGTGSVQITCSFRLNKIMDNAVTIVEPCVPLACWSGVGKLLPQTKPCAEGGLQMNWDQIESKWAAMTRRVGGEFSITKATSKDKSSGNIGLDGTGAANSGAGNKNAGIGVDPLAKAGPAKRSLMSTQ